MSVFSIGYLLSPTPVVIALYTIVLFVFNDFPAFISACFVFSFSVTLPPCYLYFFSLSSVSPTTLHPAGPVGQMETSTNTGVYRHFQFSRSSFPPAVLRGQDCRPQPSCCRMTYIYACVNLQEDGPRCCPWQS